MIRSIRSRLGRLKRSLVRLRSPVDLGRLDRVEPLSSVFGLDRGTAIDRRYIQRFLAEHAARIRGRVLEVGDSAYTDRFGGARVTERAVLHAPPGAPGATIVADLSNPDELPKDAFDCFICTQTLNFVYDTRRALDGARRLLRPGGSLLVTVGGISRVSRFERDRWGCYWSFTTGSVERLLSDAFGRAITVRSYGNVLGATAFLHGLAVEDLPDPALLDADDPDYPVVVAAVAEKPR
ncbi:MAG TPA: methyltransferase domain-containing protein [Candidatus Dormibacteraeota bacterium]|nr:methyltransferase domain-containing protein [Candidatus Dormibacteraeota bacterium]